MSSWESLEPHKPQNPLPETVFEERMQMHKLQCSQLNVILCVNFL